MKFKLAIYGAGGLGREVLAMLHALPAWEMLGFYDDGLRKGDRVAGHAVLGGMEDLIQTDWEIQVILALGNPMVKKRLVQKLSRNSFIHFPTLIHPLALIQDPAKVKIGRGSIICAGTILTTSITVGSHVLLNLKSTVGHDVRIGDYSSIMPGVNLAGDVTVGEAVLVGSGANILNGIDVGDDSRVGAGAVVTKDVQQHTTVVGVPARLIREST